MMLKECCRSFLLSCATISVAIATAYPPLLQAQEQLHAFDIPAQDLGSALRAFARASLQQVAFEDDAVKGKRSVAVQGNFTARAALDRLLSGSGLSVRTGESGLLIVAEIAKTSVTGEGQSGVSSPNGAPAAGSDASRSAGLEEVIVTAQKREQSIMDVPMSVAVLGNEQLERSGIASLEGVAQSTPSLTVLQQGAGASTYIMRGVGNIAGTSPLVGIYFDEISLAKGGLFGAMDLRVFDLERVEVLKGPQGTLYGEGSVGGTIRLISKDPQFDGLGGKADVAGTFTDGGDPGSTVRGVVNLPVIDDVLGFRVAATYDTSGGWVDVPGESRNNVNGGNSLDARIKGLWRPLEGLEIRGTFMVHDGNYDIFPSGTTPDQKMELALPEYDFSGYNDYKIGNLTATYHFGPVELLSTTSYVDEKKDYTFNQFVRLAGFPDTSPPVGIITGTAEDVRNFTQELRLASSSGSNLTWNVGFYYRDLQLKNHTTSTVTLAGSVLSQTPSYTVADSKSWALFGNASYALTNRLEVGAGLRYFEDHQELATTFDPLGLELGESNEARFDSLNPRVYLSYRFSDRATAYANVAKGFRSGGFNSSNNPPYQPEELISYELGVKGTLLDGALRTEAAVFFSNYEKAQMTTVIVRPGNIIDNLITNVGEAEIKGIEASLAWNITDRFNLNVSGSYIHSEVTGLGGATLASHEVGDPLELVPKYSLSISGQYALDWAATVPGFVRLDYTQQGRSTSTNRSSGIVPPQGTSDVIGLLGARVNAQWHAWYGEIFGENLLNENGKMDPWDYIGRAGRPRPLTVGVRVGRNF